MKSQIPNPKTQTPKAIGAAALAVLVGALCVGLNAQQQIRTAKQMPLPAKPDWAKLEVETLHVQGKVHMIAGAGGNIGVQVGEEGILLVDTGYEQMSGKVLDALRKLSDGTLRIIDYKTGRAPDRDRSIQLAVYALCAEQRLEGYRGRRWRTAEAAYVALGDRRPWVAVMPEARRRSKRRPRRRSGCGTP